MGRPLYSSSGVSRVYTQLILVLRLFLLTVLSAVDLSFIGPCSSTTRRQARAPSCTAVEISGVRREGGRFKRRKERYEMRIEKKKKKKKTNGCEPLSRLALAP